LIIVHILITLTTIWSINVKILLQYKRIKDPKESSYVYVEPILHKGKKELCLVKKENNFKCFEYQKLKFFYNEDKKQFEKVTYPDSENILFYKKSKGLKDLSGLFEKYGYNIFQIPNPEYLELLKEHIQAPFFIFQMFCCILWSLDEYWYYSMFTMVMLFVFENTLIRQRMKNLEVIKETSTESIPLYVFRNSQWTLIKSDKLFPNDIVSITK
jgi:cation-transporting ATPase 13A1